MPSISQVLLVAGLGVAGVLARYGLDLALGPTHWPISTFAINLAGSFAAGLLFGFSGRLSPELQTGLMTGFLGGFTTFSAFSLQGARMLATAPGMAISYAVLSPALGILLAWGGLLLARGL